MRRLFSRLFARADLHPQRACFVIGPDVAHEDWAPVPPSAVGTDWGTWLQEGEAPPSSAGAGSGEESQCEPGEEQRWQEVLAAFAEHLTEEELLIIKKQMSG